MEGTPREGLEITKHTMHLTVHCNDITGRIEQIVVQVTCCRAFSPLVHEQRRMRQTVLTSQLLVKLRYHAVTPDDTGLIALLDESGAQKIAAGADIVMVIRIKIYGRLLGLCLGKQLEKAAPEVDPYKRTRNAVAAYQKRDIVSARLVECLYRTVRSHINLVIFLAVERTEGRKLRLVAAFYVFYIGSYRLAVIHSVGKYLAVLLIAYHTVGHLALKSADTEKKHVGVLRMRAEIIAEARSGRRGDGFCPVVLIVQLLYGITRASYIIVRELFACFIVVIFVKRDPHAHYFGSSERGGEIFREVCRRNVSQRTVLVARGILILTDPFVCINYRSHFYTCLIICRRNR